MRDQESRLYRGSLNPFLSLHFETRPFRWSEIWIQDTADISFNWRRIWQEIARKLGILPESYEYRESKLLASFRQDLCSATRQLVLADPQWLASSAAIIHEHRYVKYLRELIDWRLQMCGTQDNEWNSDNSLLWRLRLHGSTTPPEAEEQAGVWFERGEYERAQEVFQFLIDRFRIMRKATTSLD